MDRYLHAIYCDDIRYEMGNKQSLMGIYTSDLWIPEAPAILPKLCVIANIATPLDKPFTKLIIRIMRDDETIIEAPLIDDQLHQPQLKIIENEDKDNPHRSIGLVGIFVLSPFSIEKECTLRVRAETENGELIGNGIEIKIGQPPVEVN